MDKLKTAYNQTATQPPDPASMPIVYHISGSWIPDPFLLARIARYYGIPFSGSLALPNLQTQVPLAVLFRGPWIKFVILKDETGCSH
jgi:hypothetical protein